VYLLSVFSMSGLSRLSDGAMDALGHCALRELVVLPVWPGSGPWMWAVRGLIGGVGLLGLHRATGRWRLTGHRNESPPDPTPWSRSVRRSGTR
jgi:hypothetical protein